MRRSPGRGGLGEVGSGGLGGLDLLFRDGRCFIRRAAPLSDYRFDAVGSPGKKQASLRGHGNRNITTTGSCSLATA
jgi:hypothetical protein